MTARKQPEREVVGPKSPKQEMMLAADADIVLLGGAAGSSKSYIALMSIFKYCQDPYMRAIIFRKTTQEIVGQGGLWETAQELYRKLYGDKLKVRQNPMKITFPSGGSVLFSHMEQEKDRFRHQGNQYSYIIFDEATHFSLECVEYLGTRLRSAKAKHKRQILLTCNPDPDHFLLEWVKPYLQEDGTPDKSKDGMVRYFVVEGGRYIWADTREELEKIYGKGDDNGITSFTFISATCEDNPPLLEADPQYISRLKSKPYVDMQRLLYGNWYAREEGASYFKREWCEIVPPAAVPLDCDFIRAWDLAGTPPSENYRNPDWSVGVLMARSKDGVYYLVDVVRFRDTWANTIEKIHETAREDGIDVQISIPREVGVAGKALAGIIIKGLSEKGFIARSVRPEHKKTTRFAPVAQVAEDGYLKLVRNDEWNETYLKELEAFDGSRNKKDDWYTLGRL